MTGFMNADLEKLRDNLECGHCFSRFKGSDSQARKVKYENRTVYCSAACRIAAFQRAAAEQAVREGKQLRKGVLSGPCKTCGVMFESRITKMFCSMDCYTKSPQFKSMLSKNREKISGEEIRSRIADKLRKGVYARCLECDSEFYQKRPRKSKPAKKFCCMTCYRSYLAKRFDRWIANPEGMALPQCYDEFLDQEELRCVVDGCNWKGLHLTLHINQAHGIRADEFKRAAGFNLSTGVVGKSLAMALRERSCVGVALETDKEARLKILEMAHEAIQKNPIRYRSLEGREHARKAREMLGAGPVKTCCGCGKTFQQKTPMGRALYCSPDCRDRTYAEKNKANAKERVRRKDGTFNWI